MECEHCAQQPEIPAGVFDALRRVRDDGLADMYDRENVIGHVAEAGQAEAQRWLVANRHLYFRALNGLPAAEVEEDVERTLAVRAA